MSFKTVEFTLATALAASGTVAPAYPEGTSKGSFVQSNGKHVLVAGHNVYNSPADFTLSFGASTITLTWGSGNSTLPAGTNMKLQLEQAGQNGYDRIVAANPAKMVDSRHWLVLLGSPATADADGVCASQSVTANVAATINGALAVNSVGVFDVPRNVVAAWTTSAVITVTGKDEYGNTLIEQSGSGTSFTGAKAFKTVTSVTFSANVTGATVGTGNVLGLPVFLPSASNVRDEIVDGYSIMPGKFVSLPFVIGATALAAPTDIEIVSPVRGYVSRLRTIVNTAIVTGGDVTVKVNNAAVTGLSVTIADSAIKGTAQTDTPTTAHDSSTVVAPGDRIQIVSSAGFNGGGDVNGTVEIETVPQGVVVAGSVAKATATTGDVRGTYTPTFTPDGTASIALLLALPDPGDKGISQYAG